MATTRIVIARRYDGPGLLDSASMRRALRLLEANSAAAGLMWAIATLGIYAFLQGALAMTFMIFVCGSVAVAALFMGLAGNAFMWLAVPQLGSLAAVSVMTDATHEWPVAVMIPIFGATMNRAAREFRDMAASSIRQGFEADAANAQLKEAKEAAEAANRAKSAFLATMSHEIRTPMNGVVGMAEVLAHDQLTPSQIDSVRTIRDSAVSLLGLIDGILDFSKIEAGGIELERLPVDVEESLESVCDALAPLASAKKIDLQLFVSPALDARVWGDPTRLRQVLYNLVGNAIKFSSGTGRRGRVCLRAEPVESDVEGGLPMLRLQVSDNGIGMTQDTVSRLFIPFTQAERSTTRRFGGTGLGLVICERLVELMQGDLAVDSQIGAGSTFTVRLPLQFAEETVGNPATVICSVSTACSFQTRN